MALTSYVTNQILDNNGNPVVGVSIRITLRGHSSTFFRVDDATAIGKRYTTTTDSNGQWSIALERNNNITPSPSWYEVVELVPRAQGGSRVHTIAVRDFPTSLLGATVGVTEFPAEQNIS